MSIPCYIGDEASAAGFRLAGARVIVPLAGDETAALAATRESATLVLISADVATRISAPDLAIAQAALAPLVLIVPDLRREVPMPDLAARLRGQLGLEEAP
jgi:vacuolar-type H+-ATPase subunit F/Vma7